VTVNGLVQSQTGKTGHTTTYSYDALERPTGTADPRVGTNTTHYESHGWVDYVEDAAGNRTTYEHDPDTGRMVSQTDALTNTVRFAYAAHGQKEKTWAAGPIRSATRMTGMTG